MVDVFTRSTYAELLLESPKYCLENKGLEIYAWAIISNHCYLILRAEHENLSDIIRDIKKITSKKITKAIEENPDESRKQWLSKVLRDEGKSGFGKKL